MSNNAIGLNAGKVWKALQKAGKTSMLELSNKLGLTIEEIAFAIGWLARENKIHIHSHNGTVELADENHFSFSFFG